LVNVESLPAAYRRQFGGAEPTALVRAPGRVNLIGEHTDYNQGLVLPIAIDRATYAVAGPGGEGRVRIFSATLDRSVDFDLQDNPPPATVGWDAYPRGVAAELTKVGVPLVGAQIYLESDLPIGAGLSSSAALEVSVALGLLAVAGRKLPPVELARLCRLAEHNYAGVPCGIMDQFVCTMAAADSALLLDCRDEQSTPIPWPDDEALVLIIDSGCRRRLSDGVYADRVRECALAVGHFQRTDPTVSSLRDVALRRLDGQRSALEDTIFRRARHVITENQRTADAADALRRGDYAALGRAMNESHASLGDDYQVSSPQLDDLAEAVRGVPGVFGARMTGAGFGGCVVAVATPGAAGEVESAVRKRYDTKYGGAAQMMASRPGRGAGTTMITK
jgi:galactokinase